MFSCKFHFRENIDTACLPQAGMLDTNAGYVGIGFWESQNEGILNSGMVIPF
jgi:hypothetical protein